MWLLLVQPLFVSMGLLSRQVAASDNTQLWFLAFLLVCGTTEGFCVRVPQVFKVEAALLALFDDQRIFIRNAQGFQRGDFPWRWSFCAWCMATPNPEVLLVEDVDQDARCAPFDSMLRPIHSR